MVANTSYVNAISFDGSPVTASWSDVPSWGFSYVAFPISHGPHIISTSEGSAACFVGYVYGHSKLEHSCSAYGYTVGFAGKYQ